MHLNLLTPTGALRAWWALSIVVLATLLGVGFTIVYATDTVRSNDRQWCDLLTSLDQPLPDSPATTNRQRVIARSIHELRTRKGCR